ncbi:MAG: hypothetical protein ACEPOZ_11755 [Marinifilaceae bacterium]
MSINCIHELMMNSNVNMGLSKQHQQPLTFRSKNIYSCDIASTGHTSAHAPQSIHASGSIT